MSWARPLLRIQRFQLLPGARLDTISMEIVNSIVPIVPTEDVNASAVDHSSVSISGTGWLRAAVRIQLTPVIGRKIEAKEVITAISSIIATKNVKVVVESDGSMKTSRAWWVHLILLRLLYLVPGVGLLEHVRVGPSNYISTIEQRRIET